MKRILILLLAIALLLVKARRTRDLGMAVMVNFHYSDFWADPKKQNIPAAWSGKTYEEIKALLAEHTRDVLSMFKAEGIEPRWVQVGNETSNGFYQPLYDSNLDTLAKYGARWDIVGMSLYPYWALDSGLETDDEEAITHCMRNIVHVWEKYRTPVMIVETGFEVDESHPEVMEKGREQLRRIIRESRATGHCEGIFYWEPECRPFQYRLGAFDSEGRPTVIMDGFGE